jgi:hypothetical protein
VRVELRREDGLRFWAQISPLEAERLELVRGQTVFVRAERGRTFGRALPVGAGMQGPETTGRA